MSLPKRKGQVNILPSTQWRSTGWEVAVCPIAGTAETVFSNTDICTQLYSAAKGVSTASVSGCSESVTCRQNNLTDVMRTPQSWSLQF